MSDHTTQTWVHQEDPYGCGLAVLAMLTDEPYDAVKTEVDSWEGEGHNGDWSAGGVTHYTLDRYLIARGFYLQRIYKDSGLSDWPPDPWAPVHFASVKQPSGNSHFVFMDVHGRVLDPMREGVFTLADWPGVNNVVGLVRP